MHRLDTILATPIPHKEPMSALLPHNMNPWLAGYRSLTDSMKPINHVDSPVHLYYSPDAPFWGTSMG